MTRKSSPDLFSSRVVNNTSLAIVDQILYKLGAAGGFVLLVRLLPEEAIVAFGIAIGYLVLLKYLDIGIVRILLRDYPKIAASLPDRDRHFTAYLVFLGIQVAAMLLVSLGTQVWILEKLSVPGLSFLFFGLTLEFLALVVQDWVKLIFYTDLRQAYATRISFALTVIRLASYGILVLIPTLTMFAWLLIGTAVFNCLVWMVVFQRSFALRPVLDREVPRLIRFALSDYGIWDHFNRVTLETLLYVDMAVLSLFGRLEEIGPYTVALRIGGLLTLVPQQLQRSLQIVLSNYRNERERSNAINSFLKANSLLSVAQMAVIIVGGPFLIRVLFGADVDLYTVYAYAVPLAAAITVKNLSNPLAAVVNSFCSLRRAFFHALLPITLFGGGLYVSAAWLSGALALAYSKLFVLTILAMGLILFTRRHYPFSLRLQLVTREEKNLLVRLWSGLKLRRERIAGRFTSG